MLLHDRLRKPTTVFLILMVMLTMVNTFAAAKVQVAERGSRSLGAGANSESAHPAAMDSRDCKPPKNSYVDYGMFFSCSTFLHLAPIDTLGDVAGTGIRPLSGSLPEILIPPKI